MGEPEAPEDTSPSPSFTAPPLLEVALAVEFAPIANFGATTMAALATEWQARYPRVQEHPPLPPNLPVGATAPPAAGMTVSVGAPQIRLWLLSDSEDRLVQLQRDRMVVNWRLAGSGQPYPRYHTALRPEFETNLRQLLAFLDDRSLPVPRVISTEATYVNLVANSRADLVGVLRSQTEVQHHLGTPVATRLSQNWSRPTDDGIANSMFSLNAESRGGAEVMLTLTGRSLVKANAELADVLGALDLCHDDVVTSFVDLTDGRRHSEWGRTS